MDNACGGRRRLCWLLAFQQLFVDENGCVSLRRRICFDTWTLAQAFKIRAMIVQGLEPWYAAPKWERLSFRITIMRKMRGLELWVRWVLVDSPSSHAAGCKSYMFKFMIRQVFYGQI